MTMTPSIGSLLWIAPALALAAGALASASIRLAAKPQGSGEIAGHRPEPIYCRGEMPVQLEFIDLAALEQRSRDAEAARAAQSSTLLSVPAR